MYGDTIHLPAKATRQLAPVQSSPSFFPKTGLALAEDEVQVWQMRLDMPVSRILHLARTLSPTERDRATRFRSLPDRNRFITRRGILRQICSAYLTVEPERLMFEQGPWGKPRLSGLADHCDLRFSVSCSHMVAVYAFTLGREVGVDVEQVRHNLAWEPSAAECLTARERALLQIMPEDAQVGAFLTLWTRKEAYVKARGTGLSTPLNRIDVLGRRTWCGVLVRDNGEWREPWSGTLQDIEMGRHHAAALATEEQGLKVVCREWY